MQQLIIGKKAILDAINTKILISATISSKDKNFLQKVKRSFPSVQINNDKSFYDKITNNYPHHQFAIGYVNQTTNNISLENFLQKKPEQTKKLVLLLDGIEDPQNFGAIIRTSEAFGVDAIIYKKNNQCQITPTVIKTSCGAISNIALIKVVNLNQTIPQLKKYGFWIYAGCLDKDSLDLKEIKFNDKTAIIVGNENKGISNLIYKNIDFKVKIKLFGKTPSLNVSSATAILIYSYKIQN